MRFCSRDGETKRVASISGHILRIGKAFIEVPAHMEGEAFAAGCLSEEVFTNITAANGPGINAAPPVDRPATVKLKIQEMLDGDDPTFFTTKGTPNRTVLDELCTFKVTKEEFEAAWEAVSGPLTDAE